jgi:ribosomal protein S18 acetylase RimI-like enzyme
MFATSLRVFHQIDYKIRPLTPQDEPILWTMLYHGLNTGEPGTAPAPELVRRPEFARYVEGWGGPHDVGFVAYASHEQDVLGAVWFRSPIPGHDEPQPSDEDAPELAYAVAPAYRRRGIGAALFTQWVRAHPEQSVISLRVNSRNPVVRLYERFGFRVARETPESVTLRRDC